MPIFWLGNGTNAFEMAFTLIGKQWREVLPALGSSVAYVDCAPLLSLKRPVQVPLRLGIVN